MLQVLGIATGALITVVSLFTSIGLSLSMTRHRIDLKPGVEFLHDTKQNALKAENYSEEGQRMLRRLRIVESGIIVGMAVAWLSYYFLR